VGKSCLGRALATDLGWDLQSTDELARHPGRPWQNAGPDQPEAVTDYFTSRSDTQLIDDLWLHYRQNVWPIARAIVACRLNNEFDSPLVLEGSAVLPELIHELSDVEASSLWLVANENLISERIRQESSYEKRVERERSLIDTFTRRAVAFDNKLRMSLVDTDRQSFEASNEISSDQIARIIRDKVLMM